MNKFEPARMMIHKVMLWLVAGTCFMPSGTSASSFGGLGFLPGQIKSNVKAVSADGSVIVGYSGLLPTAWFGSPNPTGLEFLFPSDDVGRANGVSGDGQIIVGTAGAFSAAAHPFVWTTSDGVQPLEGFSTTSATADAISSNGKVIVGHAGAAYRWTQETGPTFLPNLPGTVLPTTSAVSADGDVVVGYCQQGLTSGPWFACRWDGLSVSPLPAVSGTLGSFAYGVSSDGQFVVGGGAVVQSSIPMWQAYRWESSGQQHMVPPLPGETGGIATSITADGSIVAGISADIVTSSYDNPFVWDATHGTRSVSDLLTANGGDLAGWSLSSIVISGDGSIVAGDGTNPQGQTQAWVGRLAPQPVVAVTSVDSRQVLTLDGAGNAIVTADSSDGLLSPLGIASDGGQGLFVADTLASKIHHISSLGQVGTFASLAQGVFTPTGIAADAAGGVVVADYLVGQVNHLDSGAQITHLAGSSQGIARPFDVASDSFGNLYVPDVDARMVFKIGPSGQVTVFADSSDGLLAPISVAVNGAGHVFVSDALQGRIYEFDASGHATLFADASDGLATPTGIDFDANGNLYVANYLGNNVLRFTPSGVGQVISQVNRPWDITGLAAPPAFAAVGIAVPLSLPEPSGFVLALIGVAVLVVHERLGATATSKTTLSAARTQTTSLCYRYFKH